MKPARLENPSEVYKESFIEALEEFQSDPGGGRYSEKDIADFKEDFNTLLHKIEMLKSPDPDIIFAKVPQSEYWLINNDKYIGRVTIRHKLNPQLEKIGGHIGYDIRPTERKKDYGKKILELGIEKANNWALIEYSSRVIRIISALEKFRESRRGTSE